MSRSVLLLIAAGFCGCAGTGSVISVPLPTTAIVVDPADFMGNVPCLPAEGAMRRYVATLTSVHAGGAIDAGAVALPSSPPVSCAQTVSFQRVVDGTEYVADIDGYDIDDIRPLGSADGGPSGSRVMVDGQGHYVAPRWTTSCGKQQLVEVGEPRDAAPADGSGARDAGGSAGPSDARPDSLDTGVVPYGRCTGHALEAGQAPNLGGPVCAIANLVIPMRGCEPLREVNPQPDRKTAVTVDLNDSFGICLGCGTGPGEIAEFKVERDGSGEPPKTAPCGQPVTFDEVPEGALATFSVTAYGSGSAGGSGVCPAAGTATDAGPSAADAGGDACDAVRQSKREANGIWCTRCYRQPISGVTLRAVCDPLGSTKPPPY